MFEEGSAEVPKRTETQPRLEQVDLRQRLEYKFNQAFGEVSRENKPKILVETFPSYHDTAEGLDWLDERIKKADIYIPEAFEWKKEHLELFRDVSYGRKSPRRLRKGLEDFPAFFKTLEIVHKSRIPITIIDVPYGDPLVEKSERVNIYDPPLTGEFTDVSNYTRDFLDGFAQYEDEHEQHMVDEITPEKIEELLKKYPQLRNKGTINILLSLGLNHSSIPPDYPESSFTDQGIVTHRLGGKADDELAARIFLERVFYSLIRDWSRGITKDSRKVSNFQRRVFSQFDNKDAEEVFGWIKENPDFFLYPPAYVPSDLTDLLGRMFEKKNIVVPHTEERLDEILARPMPTQNQNAQGQ